MSYKNTAKKVTANIKCIYIFAGSKMLPSSAFVEVKLSGIRSVVQNMKYKRTTPVTQVQAAPQRNQYKVRGMSSGTTFFFVSPSIVAATCPLMKLKKYKSPIQVIPAMICNHLKMG
jgi:hypothetical protein